MIIPTFGNLLMLMQSSPRWFFGVGIAVLVLFFITKFLLKGVKWLVLLVVFGIILFFLYGTVFAMTF